MAERRKTIRTRTFLGGTIAYDDGRSTVNGLVRNLSPEGANIVTRASYPLPEHFAFHIDQQRRSYRARIVWRDADEAGLAFCAETSDAPAPVEWARRLRKSEAENAALRRRIEELSMGY